MTVVALACVVDASDEFVHVTGVSSFLGGNTPLAMWYQMDRTCTSSFSSPGFDFRVFDHNNPDQTSVTQDMTVPVTAGPHTFRLCAQASLPTTAAGSTLSVETVNVGAAG